MKLSKIHQKRIDDAITELNCVMEEVRKKHPKANYYLEDSCNLNVLSDDSHDDNNNSHQERIMYSVYLDHSGGGGW